MKLFVSYATTKGFGSCVVNTKDSSNIESMSDIKILQELIAEEENIENPIVINMVSLPIS